MKQYKSYIIGTKIINIETYFGILQSANLERSVRLKYLKQNCQTFHIQFYKCNTIYNMVTWHKPHYALDKNY